MGVVDTPNIGMQKVYLQTGYKIIGKKTTLVYLVAPLNQKGYIFYCLLKTFFPLIKILLSILYRKKEWQPE